MFGNCLAILDMSWECLSPMNPGFSEVSSFSLELLAVCLGNRDTSKVHCLLNKHLGMWRKTWVYKNPTNIPWSTNCRAASLLQGISQHLAFQNIFWHSWCRMFHPSSTTDFVAAVLSNNEAIFCSRQVAAPIAFKTQKPSCASASGTGLKPAELCIREIRSIFSEIFHSFKWWEKPFHIVPPFLWKTRIFQKGRHFLYGRRWKLMRPNNHQSKFLHPELRVELKWISQRLFSDRPSCWSEIEVTALFYHLRWTKDTIRILLDFVSDTSIRFNHVSFLLQLQTIHPVETPTLAMQERHQQHSGRWWRTRKTIHPHGPLTSDLISSW